MTELHKPRKPSLRKQKNMLLNYLTNNLEATNFVLHLYENNPKFLTQLYDNYIVFKETEKLNLDAIHFDYNHDQKRKNKIIRKRTTEKTPILLS